MGKITFIFGLLFISTVALAAVFPTGPSLTIGGQVMVGNSTADESLVGQGNLIILNAGVSGASRYSGLVQIGKTTAYTPSGSKKFVAVGAALIAAAATSTPFYFSSCDAAIGTCQSGTAPTNPVYIGSGASGTINAELGFVTPAVTGGINTLAGPILTIPNGKFGCADNTTTGSGTAFVYGYEQ